MSRSFECGMCMITPRRDRLFGTRAEVKTHLREEHDITDYDLYVTDATEQQTL